MLDLNDLLKGKDPSFDPSNNGQSEKLEDKLSEININEIEEEVSDKAREMGLPYINLKDFPISQEALRLIPEEDAKNYNLVCFYRTENSARVACSKVENPALTDYLKKLEEAHGIKVSLYLISDYSFKKVIERYSNLPKITEIKKEVSISPEEFKKFKEKIKSFRDLNEEIKKAKTTDLITMIMASAVQSDASDVHIEAEEEGVKVRFRIDGILIDVAELNKELWSQIVSRIKLLASLKINVTDRPQDGRFTVNLEGEKTDIRVSCLPTSYGESVVMRLLQSSSVSLEFEELGLRKEAYNVLNEQIKRPNGMIITTGPTGSGKTTTLYAILNKLNKPETKIITLENPIEYQLKGINQSQVDRSRDYTFAKGLRSILRQDPDIVMVGEIRDSETAEIATQAALTGHLVISTLHTNDAGGALPRFLSMGVKPFLLAPSINAVIGQRLVRRVCEHCKKEINLDQKELEKVKKILSEIPKKSGIKVDFENLKFYQGEGCEKCQGLGYKGRTGIYEVFTVSDDIEKAILEGELSEYRIKELAHQQGMVTMVQDGVLKALEGITSIEEVFRVIE